MTSDAVLCYFGQIYITIFQITLNHTMTKTMR